MFANLVKTIGKQAKWKIKCDKWRKRISSEAVMGKRYNEQLDRLWRRAKLGKIAQSGQNEKMDGLKQVTGRKRSRLRETEK